ncbi:hypothetical protein NM688_g7147 [Phlebia brevispora]|uniref:Uncharacterized protein n=1 Tax=Phlebia brevispora TaxID=194682 RepID=A0ACC1S8V2_9APHY|nr:hypothetical protein NM688_g7147 [Phlebia brevispora]
MAGGELVLKFVYPPADANQDPRTVEISRVNGSDDLSILYKFFHPNTGSKMGVTTLQRKSPSGTWDTVGHVEWSSNTTAKVRFGTEEMPMKELRREKKPGQSKSRRFKAGNAEYKWKIADNGKDFLCASTQLTSFGKNIAEWSQDEVTLRVSERAENILDRVVMTCFLNIWMKNLGRW